MIFIDIKNWACEKTSLPFEIADRRFHSAARPQNSTAEWSPERTGELRRYRNRRSQPQNQSREKKSIKYERRFRTAAMTADRNRGIKPELSSLKRRFQFGGQTADSPKVVNPKEKPRAFSIGGPHAKPSTMCASVDVSEQHRETNYKTHKTHNKIQHQSASVKCDM